MGIIAALIGGLIGYTLSKNVIAENWWYKLCYALFCPLMLITICCIIGND